MAHDIAPGFIKVEYHSQFGPHTMILPVNTISPDVGIPANSTIETWAGGSINAIEMTDALITTLLPRFPATVTFDRGTLFNKPTPGDLPEPVSGWSIDLDGTQVTPGWAKATQETITARDTAFNIVKIVELDYGSGNNFEKQISSTVAGLDDVITEWFASTNGWASRAGLRPSVFVSATRTLNEQLRRAYKMT
jgi:hypothetical protein